MSMNDIYMIVHVGSLVVTINDFAQEQEQVFTLISNPDMNAEKPNSGLSSACIKNPPVSLR